MNQEPTLKAGASSSSPKDDWVECSVCKKWRLICVRDVKADNLPQNWECQAMTWLPGFNSCEFSEETTTFAGYRLLGVPAHNIDIDILHAGASGYDHVAKKCRRQQASDAAWTRASLLPVPLLTKPLRSRKKDICYQGDFKLDTRRSRESKVRKNHPVLEDAGRLRVDVRLGSSTVTADTRNGRNLSYPRCSRSESRTLCSPTGLKKDLKARAGTVLNEPYESRGRSEGRCGPELETATRGRKDEVVTDEFRCTQYRSLRVFSQSRLKMTSEVNLTGGNGSGGRDREKHHPENIGLPQRSPEASAAATKEKQQLQEVVRSDLPKLTKESKQVLKLESLLTNEVRLKESQRLPQLVEFSGKRNDTELTTNERTWEPMEVPTKESREVDTKGEIRTNNSFRKEKADIWVMNARMEAAALIRAAADCRKSMPHMEDEKPIGDLYLQAGLKYLQAAQHQETIKCKGSQESGDTSFLQCYMDGAKMFDDCTEIYEKVPDHGKAALCHILSGVTRMRILTAVMPTSSAEPSTKSTVSLLVPSSLQVTYVERFLQNSRNISPMLDSWMKARICLASAEASGGDSRTMRAMKEVRKVCQMAMFDDYDKLVSQVYVAMDAFNY